MSEVTEHTIKEMEEFRDQQKALLERRQAVQKLKRNREFRKVILEDFMVAEAARYARESGDPALDEAARADCLAIAQAAGHLKRYLDVVERMGISAEREMGNIESSLDEYRAELGNG